MAKQKALEIYASDLHRKLEALKRENEEKNQILKEINQKDWVKTIQSNNVRISYFFKFFPFSKKSRH